MNVLIISTNQNQFPMPVMPVGACAVAEAAFKAGHNTSLLDLMFENDPLSAIERNLETFRPDVVGFSVRNIDNNDFTSPVFYLKELPSLINAVKRKVPDIILGGAAVSVMPEALLRHCGASLAVTGDGENTFVNLLERLSLGRGTEDLPGVARLEKDEFKMNVESCPPRNSFRCESPDFPRWINVKAYRKKLATVPLQTKLGCHFKCSYCTYRKIQGSDYQLSAPAEVADTVNRLAASGFRHIEFVDNVFNSPYEHALSICAALAKKKPQAFLQSLELNPLFVDDMLLGSMERAGFSGIGITVESAADPVLAGLKKGFNEEHVYKAAEIVNQHKLSCVWIFMLGGPGETRETLARTFKFATKYIRPGDVAFFGLGVRIYPGTELETLAREQGVLSLPPNEMLEPVFYLSPEIDYGWLHKQIKKLLSENMNFISTDSLSFPFLLPLNRLASGLGVQPPLWRYTRYIRRGLRLLGMDA